MKHSAAAIIPAYNEEKTIAEVVKVVNSSPLVQKVLVISDGSTDKTAEIAKKAGATVHQLPKKGGKGEAMLHGVTHTDSSVIVFFDADLIGLTHDHIDRLLQPIFNGSKYMNVGIRDRGPVFSRLARHLPLIGGERAMQRHIIEGIQPKYLKGFMVESAMNYHCRINKWPYGSVFLPKLGIRRKYEKVGLFRGMIEYLKMWKQVNKAMILVRLARLRKDFP